MKIKLIAKNLPLMIISILIISSLSEPLKGQTEYQGKRSNSVYPESSGGVSDFYFVDPYTSLSHLNMSNLKTKKIIHKNDTLELSPKYPTLNGYVEALGPGGIGSINLELRFRSDKHMNIAGRIGIGHTYYITVPIGINLIFGKESNFFETGFGITVEQNDFLTYPFFTMGYRYHKFKGGLLFRININLTDFGDGDGLIPFPGISIGW